MENPCASFPEFLSPARTRCIEIALKTSHRIGQDAAHQAHYRLDCGRSTPRGIKLRGHERISAKIVTCVTNCRVDSCSWLFHVATYLASGLPKMKSPHGRGCFWGEGDRSGASSRVGDLFCGYFRVKTFHCVCVKNDRTNACSAGRGARALNRLAIRDTSQFFAILNDT